MSKPDLHVLPAVKWIWDPSFRYTPSYATDLRKTFERIRRQMQRVQVPANAAWTPQSGGSEVQADHRPDRGRAVAERRQHEQTDDPECGIFPAAVLV